MTAEELRAEARRLKQAAAASQKACQALSRVSGSPAVAARAEEFRCQRERLLVEIANLLEPALKCVAELEEANRKLAAQAAELKTAHQRLLIHFRQQLGVVPKSMQTDKLKQAEMGGNAEGPVSATGQAPAEKSGAPPKKRGAPVGHKGASRPVPKPEDVTETRTIPPPSRCACGCDQILALDEFDDLYIEDIPPILRHYIRLRHQRGQCGRCGGKLRHDAAVAGQPVVIGPNLSILLSVMRQAGLTYRRLAGLSTDLFGIPLTAAGTLGIVSRTTESLRPCYEEIEAVLRDQNVLNIDETGWKINFATAYIWCLCNPRLAWFHPNTSRAGNVIKAILGEDFAGTVICDFYGGYNFFKNLQRCLVHFLRDLHTERKIMPGSQPLERFETAVKTMIEHGLEISGLANGSQKEGRLTKLRGELEAIIRMTVPAGKPRTLQKRLERHQDEILTFARTPEVEYHNNRGERQLRPQVVNRKNSFGSASLLGALHTCMLNSVVETCRLNSKKPVEFIRNILASARDALPSIFLVPATG